MASQTRLDTPQTDLCRRPCHVVFVKNQLVNQTSCRDTRRVVPSPPLERFLVMFDVVMFLVMTGNAGISFETSDKQSTVL